MLTLAQLRARQKNGEVSGGVVGDEKPVLSVPATGTTAAPPLTSPVKPVEGLQPATRPAIRDDSVAQRPVCPSTDLTAARGYIKIFPPRFASINQVTDEFKKEFWTTASPWCRVEEVEDHPEFENNLRIIENV